jgi:hypothetical protein
MADKSRTLKLNILAETKDLTDGLKKANVDVNNASSGMSEAFKKVGAALAAATAAAGAYAVKLAVDGVKAAIEDQAAQERLANALRNTTKATDAQIASIEEVISKTALATGVADDQLRPAFQRLAVATGDVNESQNLLNLALDISAATGKNLESVTNALGRAYEGSTTSLTRLGVGLSAAEIETLGLDGAVAQLSATFGGSAAIQAETLEGQISRLKVSFDETKEAIGFALLPILTDLFEEFTRFAIPAAERFAEVFQEDLIPYFDRRVFPAFADLIQAIGDIGDAFDNTSQDVKESNAIIDALKTTIVEFVPTTVNALEKVINVWATFLDILNRTRAFISGDLDTATREFNNRFRETEKVTNNVNDSMVNAYKQFQFFNNQTREDTVPGLSSLSGGFNGVASSSNSAANGVKALAAAQSALKKELAALQAGGVAPPTISKDLARFYRSELGLISEFGGKIEGINLLPTDPFYGFGKGGNVGQAIQQRQSGSASATGGTTIINVNGTVVDPEGAARAIQNVIQNSSARAGDLSFIPAIGFE